MERVIELPTHIPNLKGEPLLERVRGKIEDDKYLVLTDLKRFKAFLDDLVREMVREESRRANKV